ncbi:hypothetical protein D9M72_620110 [compost metagenome]
MSRNIPRNSSGASTFDWPETLRSAEIMASGFLVSSTAPASATYSRVRDRVMRMTAARPKPITPMARPIRIRGMAFLLSRPRPPRM